MTIPTCIRTQWDKHLPHDFSSYPTTIIPLSFSQLHISLHSMDFQTSEETSIVPTEFPRGWLHISQPFFSKGKWTERCKKRKYWLGIPVALKALKIFNSLELSGTAIEIQVWCHSKVMSSATHNWKERVWRQAAVSLQTGRSFGGASFGGSTSLPWRRRQRKGVLSLLVSWWLFLRLLKGRGMFQRVNWSALKAFFLVLMRSSDRHGGRNVLFSQNGI